MISLSITAPKMLLMLLSEHSYIHFVPSHTTYPIFCRRPLHLLVAPTSPALRVSLCRSIERAQEHPQLHCSSIQARVH